MTHKKGKDSDIGNISKKTKTVTLLDDYSEDLSNMEALGSVEKNVTNFSQELIPSRALTVPSHAPKSLVIESLIEQLIRFYEDDVHKRKRLFKHVCRKLSDLRFIDSSFHLEVLQPYRHKFRLAFEKLIVDIKQSVGDSNLGHITNAMVPAVQNGMLDLDSYYRLQYGAEFVPQNSRYDADFEEIKVIAQGGFGLVCEAKKRVDNVAYAIKKIPFTYNEDTILRKVLREVEVFAKLSHPNVVTYKTAWIEQQTVMSTVVRGSSDETDYSTSESNTTNNLTQNWHTCGKSYSKNPLSLQSIAEIKDENGSSDSNPDYFSSLPEPVTIVRTLLRPYSNPGKCDRGDCGIDNCMNIRGNEIEAIPIIKAVLFIQMELCRESLKEWLDNRIQEMETNGNSQIDETQAMTIFKQVLKGVHYLHSNNLIHRDLKPLNILFDQKRNKVKIGDFGLATMCCSSATMERSFHPWEQSHHSKGVGTSPYAAPEQQTEKQYDYKADMYSLGIILLELLQPFKTLMERAKCLEALFISQTIPKELQQRFPRQARIINMLVNKNPKSRPSTADLLNSDLFCTKTQEIQKQKKEIVRLRQELLLKDNELIQLKRKLQLLEIS